MMRLATVLYEDKMQVGSGGAFPPHDFLLAMIADMTDRTIWDLRRLVDKNPRNGVSKLLADVRQTDLLAGPGLLCILVDRDRIAEHVGLDRTASEAEVVMAIHTLSDDPDRLAIHFLDPNMEGLLRSIAECAPSEAPPQAKDHNARDRFLNRAAFALAANVRDCVKEKQSSLARLAALLAARCSQSETP